MVESVLFRWMDPDLVFHGDLIRIWFAGWNRDQVKSTPIGNPGREYTSCAVQLFFLVCIILLSYFFLVEEIKCLGVDDERWHPVNGVGFGFSF